MVGRTRSIGQDIWPQLSRLMTLEQGWYDGNVGETFDDMMLRYVALNWTVSDSLPIPCIFPSVEGSVRFEWTVGSIDLSVEIDQRQGTIRAYLHSLDLSDDSEFERYYDVVTERSAMLLLCTDIERILASARVS